MGPGGQGCGREEGRGARVFQKATYLHMLSEWPWRAMFRKCYCLSSVWGGFEAEVLCFSPSSPAPTRAAPPFIRRPLRGQSRCSRKQLSTLSVKWAKLGSPRSKAWDADLRASSLPGIGSQKTPGEAQEGKQLRVGPWWTVGLCGQQRLRDGVGQCSSYFLSCRIHLSWQTQEGWCFCKL